MSNTQRKLDNIFNHGLVKPSASIALNFGCKYMLHLKCD